MEILAVSNIKGGVGKTTTAVNLAYLAAVAGRATVLWDLDPQGASTYLLQGAPAGEIRAKRLVSGKSELPEFLAPTAYSGLHLVPADLSYRNFDLHIGERKHRTERLLRMIRPLQKTCDLLVMDCPPGISLLSENVLRAADAVVVPMLPAPLSLRMLEQLIEFVTQAGWLDLRVLPFFSMVDHRRSLHAEVVAEARRRFPMLLQVEVPYWSEIERMTVRRAPLPAYAPRSLAGRLYESMWQEVAARLA